MGRLKRVKSQLLWRGQPVEQLSREELLVVVHNLAVTIERNYEQAKLDRSVLSALAERAGG